MRPYWDGFGLLFEEKVDPKAAERNLIALAENIHQNYLEALLGWETWLRDWMRIPTTSAIEADMAPNYSGLMLDYAIRDILRRSTIGLTDLPSQDALLQSLGTQRYQEFHNTQISKRDTVEMLAESLVFILEDEPFIDQFDRQPWYDQLLILANLSERLHESKSGRDFLIRQISKPYTLKGDIPIVPIYHPIRLWAISGKLKVPEFQPVSLIQEVISKSPLSAGYHQKEIIDAALRQYNNLLPILTSFDVAELGQYFIDWFEVMVVRGQGPLQHFPRPTELSVFFDQVEQWRKRFDSEVIDFIGPSSQLLKSAVSLTQLIIAFKALKDDPSLITVSSTFTATIDLVNSIKNSADGIWRVRKTIHLYSTGAAALNVIVGVFDGLSNTAIGIEEWRRGHFIAAFGASVGSIGGYTETFIGAVHLLQRFTGITMISPATILTGLVLSLIIKVAGNILVAAGRSSQLMDWFEHNYFGEKWPPPVEDVINPSSMFFRWVSETSGRPRIRRQIGELNSLFFQLYADPNPPETFVSIPYENEVRVGVEIRPAFYKTTYNNEGVVVIRVPFLRGEEFITIVGIDGGRIRSGHLYQAKVGEDSSQIGPFVTGPPHVSWTADGKIKKWLIVFCFPINEVPEAIEVNVLDFKGLPSSGLASFDKIEAFPTSLLFRRPVNFS